MGSDFNEAAALLPRKTAHTKEAAEKMDTGFNEAAALLPRKTCGYMLARYQQTACFNEAAALLPRKTLTKTLLAFVSTELQGGRGIAAAEDRDRIQHRNRERDDRLQGGRGIAAAEDGSPPSTPSTRARCSFNEAAALLPRKTLHPGSQHIGCALLLQGGRGIAAAEDGDHGKDGARPVGGFNEAAALLPRKTAPR